MNTPSHFLAFDLGANSGRAIVGTIEKNEINLTELHRFSNNPVTVHGTIYWDILGLFGEIKKALRKYNQQYDADLASIGVDTWGVDFGLLNSDGSLLENPIHYRDKRTEGQVKKAFRVLSKREIFEQTGIQFMELNTLYQLFSLRKRNTPLLEWADGFLLLADLFNYLLSGEQVSEFTLATTSQLYNPQTGEWSKKIFDSFDLPREIMPQTVEPGTRIGTLLPEIQKDSGLGPVPIVAPACHDTACAVAAIPTETDRWAFCSSGTWSLLGKEISSPVIDEQVMEANFTNEGGVEDTYRFLHNLTGLWLVQECRREWMKGGEKFSYERLTEMASNAKGFAAFIDPDYSAFQGPGNMPEKISKFCKETGQRPPDSKGETIRTILESIALNYRHTLSNLERLLDEKVGVLHIVGGGVRNELLSQFSANAVGKQVITGPAEATATGNIIIQAVERGLLSSVQKARDLVRNSVKLKKYDPKSTNTWNSAFQDFKKIKHRSKRGGTK